ncbi:unnamed protein product [Mytilus edulis]|uniref:Uncharacterized protein n=1 Tax=Mytilus edulis TaxID=6550 RepID=A0A8S3TLE1_MYTED|nr:unnamed protein product [Mytilus edulis]
MNVRFKPFYVLLIKDRDHFFKCTSECILSEHNGHTLGKIKETTDSSRKATENIIEDLKSKGDMITKTLKEVKSNILPKLKSDSDKFSEMATSTSKGFQLFIDHVTTRSQTAASDFFQIEKESVLKYLASLECLRESYTKTYTKCENLLQEKHDATFLFEKKLLQKYMDSLDEIPQLISPKSIDVFKQDDFVNSVIEEIQHKFTIGILLEKQNEVDKLTNEVMKSKSISKDLEMEKNKLQTKIITENRKAMQTLKEELQEEKAKQYGQEQAKLETREDRQEIQGRQMYPDFTDWQDAFVPIPSNMDASMTEIPNKWDKKTNIDKEKQRENVVKYDTGIDDEQKRIVSAKRWNSSFESSGSKVEEKDSKQSFDYTNGIEHVEHVEYKDFKGRLIYRNRNDNTWYYVN